MQLETDEHWYSLFGFFYAQTTEEQKCEIISPHTRDTLLDEILRILRSDPSDTLKSNLLVFIEENIEFIFDDRARLQRACASLSELLSLPPIGPNSVSYRIKSQILTTLTTIMIEMDLINIQPKALESFINILYAIISQVNCSIDRILRQAAAECLREIDALYSGILYKRVGLFLAYAQEEKTHAQQSYLMLFASTFMSTIQTLNFMLEAVGAASNSELFALPENWTTACSRYFTENPISEQQLTSFEDILCDLIGVPKSLRGGSSNSSPGSTPVYSSKGSTSLSLLDTPKTSELFTIPQRPFPAQALPQHNSNLFLANSRAAGYRPFQYWITPTSYKKHPIISIVKKDIRRALTFMMESLSSVTTPETLRLMSYAIYIICETTQSSFYGAPSSLASSAGSSSLSSSVGSPTLDYDFTVDTQALNASPMIPSGANGPNGLIKGEFLFAQCKPLVRSSSPLLWHAAALAALSGVVGASSNSTQSAPLDASSAGVPFSRRLWIALLENSAWLGSVGENQSDSNDPVVLSKASRQVTLHWLPTLALRDLLSSHGAITPENPIETAISKHLHPLRRLLFPLFFDDVATIESKIRALQHVYSVPTAATDSSLLPPPTFLNVLSLLEDFVMRESASHPQVVAVFRILRFLLRRFHPLLFDDIFQRIEYAVETSPWLCERLHELLVVLRDSNDPGDATIFKPVLQKVISMIVTRSKQQNTKTTSATLLNYLPLISTVARIDFVDPTPLLQSLMRLLESYEGGDSCWSLGDKILHMITQVLLSHKPRHLFGILRELLSSIMVTYPDLDIRDRTHFLYQLLTHVPDEKLIDILTFSPPNDSEEELAAPAATGGSILGSPAPKSRQRRPSMTHKPTVMSSYSTGFEEDESSFVSRPHQSFLRLERLYPHYNFNSFVYLHSESHSTMMAAASTSAEGSQEDVLDDYLSFFNSSITDADIRVELPFLLRYKADNPATVSNLADAAGWPDSVYSVTLDFSPTGSKLIYGSSTQTVNIPILSRLDSNDATATAAASADDAYGNIIISDQISAKISDSKLIRGSFPYAYSFVLDLGISVPLPTHFITKATFNTEDGKVGEIDLDPLPLTLKDMFLPVMCARLKRPLPGRYVSDSKAYVSQLFEQMWHSIEREGEGQTSSEADSAAPHAAASSRRISQKQRDEFSTSVKFLDRPASRVIPAIETRLAPFLIDPVTSESSGTDIRAFFLLPKCYHLLFRFKIQQDSTTVRIATDFWRILGFVDRFFDELIPRQSL